MATKKKTARKTTKKTTKKKAVRKKATTRKVAVAKKTTVSEAAREAARATEVWPWPLRPYQEAAYRAFRAGKRRQLLPWHRRAGKDIFGMSLAGNEMRNRIGTYVHFFPKHVHAKRSIWRGIDPRRGARLIDIAFGDMESDRNNADMMIEMYNGSMWHLLGSDNYDRIVGGNIVGAVFSEFALCDPRAWDYIRPMLLENNGWAVFISTYRGRNHMWQMVQKLKDNPKWYVQQLDVTQTRDVDGNRIITDQDIQDERDSGMSEAMIQQEYFCNPEAVMDGAIYAKETQRLRKDESRHIAIYDAARPVYCVWNLDLPVHASYILIQPGEHPNILCAEMDDWTTLADTMAKAHANPFPIQQHILHGEQRDYAPSFNSLGRQPELVVNTNPVLEHFRASSLLERCRIDIDKAGDFLDALGGYMRRERFDSQVAELSFMDDFVPSWHHRLPSCLETFAAWHYNTGGGERSKPPDYTEMDRIAKTIL